MLLGPLRLANTLPGLRVAGDCAVLEIGLGHPLAMKHPVHPHVVSIHLVTLHLEDWIFSQEIFGSMAVHAVRTLMSTAASRESSLPGAVTGNTRGTE